MRLKLLETASAMLSANLAARAAAIDIFTVTPVSGGTSITFQLPSSPTNVNVVEPAGLYFEIYGVTTKIGLSDVTFLLQAILADCGFQNDALVDSSGPQLFTETAAAPTFLLGTFILTDLLSGTAVESLTIAPVASATVTPEPSSIALLGTGVLGIAGVVRKRFA